VDTIEFLPFVQALGESSAVFAWTKPFDLRLEGSSLRYSWSSQKDRQGRDKLEVRPGVDLFERFLSLHEGNDDEILAFAQSYGPLNLCKHNLPAAHDDFGGPCKATGIEPLDQWRGWSRRCKALLDIGSKLHHSFGHLPSEKDWSNFLVLPQMVAGGTTEIQEIDELAGTSRRIRTPHRAKSRAEQRVQYAKVFTDHFRWTGVRPLFLWSDKPQVTVAVRFGLLSAVILQVANAVVGGRFFTCDYCGAAHERERAPKLNHKAMCATCRRQRADKTHARELRRLNG